MRLHPPDRLARWDALRRKAKGYGLRFVRRTDGSRFCPIVRFELWSADRQLAYAYDTNDIEAALTRVIGEGAR
jgi:hypothetical protein